MTGQTSEVQTSGLGFTGQSVRRIEDEWLLAGHGTYAADVLPEGVLHAVFVRSPFAHATIERIDVTDARKLPGVVSILTAADINESTNPFVPIITIPGAYTPLFNVLSADKVRHVGDPVAVILAESRYIAEDAAELVVVDYTDLQPVASIEAALDPSSTPIWDKANSNVLVDATDSYGDVDRVFATADHVFTKTFRSHRQSNQPMETRGSVVEVDPSTGHLTLHNTSQAPHFLKWAIAGITVNQGGFASLRNFVKRPERRKAFFDRAKQFLGDNKESLQRSDNAGMVSQLRKDRSLLKHMGRMGAGLLDVDDVPTVKSIDIGGAFGSKGPVAREDIALVVAAQKLGQSVQWIEDRVENLTDGGQAREEDFTMSIAVDADGTMRGLKCDMVMDQGAYPSFPISIGFIKQVIKVMLPGSYRFEAYELHSRIVATNKGKVVPYRGPWANETWARERMVDVVADRLGMSPIELRLKNMYGPDELPADMITGPTMDVTMSLKGTLERAVEIIDLEQFEVDRAAAEANGHRLGLGVACYHEAAPGPPNFSDSVNPGSDMLLSEDGRAIVNADGSIQVFTSQVPHGQSHVTTYKQVTADEFGVAMEDVDIVWGDTDRSEFSFIGTGGSRGGPLGAGVLKYAAREIRTEVVKLASEMLEASIDDIEIASGNIHVVGVPARGLSYAEVAAEASKRKRITEGPAFEVRKSYGGHGDGGWSVATHITVVDIDLETGMVTIPRYLVVEDCGPIINPKIVDGQVRGAVAQGIGAVFYEHVAYDVDANPQATTYMDYLLPTAMEIPEIEVEHLETLSPGENDHRGIGEGGFIGAPAALTNAVAHALGVQVTSQYLPPSTILELAGVIEPD